MEHNGKSLEVRPEMFSTWQKFLESSVRSCCRVYLSLPPTQHAPMPDRCWFLGKGSSKIVERNPHHLPFSSYSHTSVCLQCCKINALKDIWAYRVYQGICCRMHFFNRRIKTWIQHRDSPWMCHSHGMGVICSPLVPSLPISQRSPVLPGGQWHSPVTLSHSAPEQSQCWVQPCPYLPMAHSVWEREC